MAEHIRFFTVLQPDFSTRLVLPVELGKSLLLPDNVNSSEDGKEASLIDSTSGQAWPVHVCREGNKVYLGGEKWCDFTLANGLRIGYFLEFHYRGGMLFTFRVFDARTLELTSRPPVSDLKRLSMGTVAENQAEEMTPLKMIKGKEKVEIKGRCGQIKNSRFETTMTNKNIPKHMDKASVHLYIPVKFREDIGLSVDKTGLVIQDPQGRCWNIGCFHRKRFRKSYEYRETTLTKGWAEFVRKNQLEVGDKCIFEQVSNDGDRVITIRMLPKV